MAHIALSVTVWKVSMCKKQNTAHSRKPCMVSREDLWGIVTQKNRDFSSPTDIGSAAALGFLTPSTVLRNHFHIKCVLESSELWVFEEVKFRFQLLNVPLNPTPNGAQC